TGAAGRRRDPRVRGDRADRVGSAHRDVIAPRGGGTGQAAAVGGAPGGPPLAVPGSRGQQRGRGPRPGPDDAAGGSSERVRAPRAPAATPMTTMRPPVARERTFSARLAAPTSSMITSYGPCPAKSPGARTGPAPSAATAPRLSGLRTVAMTRAPAAAPSCTAAVPTPP